MCFSKLRPYFIHLRPRTCTYCSSRKEYETVLSHLDLLIFAYPLYAKLFTLFSLTKMFWENKLLEQQTWTYPHLY